MADWNRDDDEPTGWRPEDEDDDEEQEGEELGEGALEIRVVTPGPVPLRLELVERDEVGMEESAFATFIDAEGAPERPIAVNSLPRELTESLVSSNLFTEPRHIMAAVHEEEGGLRGLLSALVPAELVERWAREHEQAEADEPWKASAPQPPAFELQTTYEDEAGDGERAQAMVPIPLGIIVRFAENRRHPDDVVKEAADLVASVLGGFGVDAKQKRIDDLLGGL
ncbi:MAG TPA: hypothetical protein VEA99_19615 [Gemmatimonadaceae bacterium]|nr:hypothetical protein [Gemmatimonadaceae bacterium]